MSLIGSVVKFVILAVLNYLLAPKPKNQNLPPASLDDVDFPTAVQGRGIPIVFGTVRVSSPNVTWYGDFKSNPIRK